MSNWTTVAPHIQRGALIQELWVDFPNATFPVPNLSPHRYVGSNGVQNRWANTSTHIDTTNDVLRTVPLREGDIRLLIGPSPTAAPYFFEAQSDYLTDNSTKLLTGQSRATGKLIAGAPYNSIYPLVPSHVTQALTSTGSPGDWDNGTGPTGDGPFINAPDAGNVDPAAPPTQPNYFSSRRISAAETTSFFSPNRMMPGPGMFGSLSTGVQRRLPWQTLLFRPGPKNHPGAVAPADHLLLDLFWMPVVEPYAISEPFSTAGKINLNQQIVPFTYINRNAALRAALATEKVAMVSKSEAATYKQQTNLWEPAAPLANERLSLNLSETNGTLRQFKEKFASGEIFRSATEICDIFLVPDGKTWTSNATAQAAWYGDDFAMVGDNTRERPYTHIYNKLTTKSNVFTVHYHAQVLQKPKARNEADPTIFDTAAGDKVAAEQRGSTTFERYLDPATVPNQLSAEGFDPDPAAASAPSLEEFYRARIVNTSVFSP